MTSSAAVAMPPAAAALMHLQGGPVGSTLSSYASLPPTMALWGHSGAFSNSQQQFRRPASQASTGSTTAASSEGSTSGSSLFAVAGSGANFNNRLVQPSMDPTNALLRSLLGTNSSESSQMLHQGVPQMLPHQSPLLASGGTAASSSLSVSALHRKLSSDSLDELPHIDPTTVKDYNLFFAKMEGAHHPQQQDGLLLPPGHSASSSSYSAFEADAKPKARSYIHAAQEYGIGQDRAHASASQQAQMLLPPEHLPYEDTKPDSSTANTTRKKAELDLAFWGHHTGDNADGHGSPDSSAA